MKIKSLKRVKKLKFSDKKLGNPEFKKKKIKD